MCASSLCPICCGRKSCQFFFDSRVYLGKKWRSNKLIILGMRQCFDLEEPEDEVWDWPEVERQ